MARVRMPDHVLNSWDDVNLCLAEIGECQRKVEAIESEMQRDRRCKAYSRHQRGTVHAAHCQAGAAN